jgi:prepilin-type N-terminal cleavage/methylation domain-containing protein/prepilin-type processing-associated H-X9-DG protein
MSVHNKSVARQRARGLTIVELMVVLAIISILAGLLIVGVSSIRESARRLTCTNNLHQFGIAIQSFESARKKMPSMSGLKYREKGGVEELGVLSIHYQLLPQLGLNTLADQPIPAEVSGPVHLATPYDPRDAIDGAPVPVFQCPSDGFGIGTSYRFSIGPDAHNWEQPTLGEGGHGPFSRFGGSSFREFSRGLSNVCLASERLRSVRDKDNRKADIWFSGLVPPFEPVPTRVCIDAAEGAIDFPLSNFYRDCGRSWFHGGNLFTYYSHALLPNSTAVSLVTSGRSNDLGWGAVVSATSHHMNGVNLLMADGSVRFVDDQIDMGVWRNHASAY